LSVRPGGARDRYVTDDEFLKVRAVAHPMVRFAMNIALITGSRQTDILKLDRKQVAAGVLRAQQTRQRKRYSFPSPNLWKKYRD
jgi:hypothetical protein